MTSDRLEIRARPKLAGGRMVLAFSGWMDGGEVSTGTVEWLIKALAAEQVAAIDPEGFYLYNFPGSMEISALFRPYTKIENGIVTALRPPANTFFCSERHQLVLFHGKEPNFGWRAFADCIFSYALRVGVSGLYFVGSVGGVAPHTREPRLMSAVSHESLKPLLAKYGVSFTNYEGPASFSTYLLSRAGSRDVVMTSLVAEIPAYVQGINPKSIEAVVRRLAAILDLPICLDELDAMAAAWEERVNTVLEEKPDLAKYIRKLEEDYDNEIFDTRMGDLKQWLQEQGIRVD